MRKYSLIAFIVILIIITSCAPPRYARRAPRQNRNEIIKNSQTMLREAERGCRDFRIRRIFFPIQACLGTPYQYGGDSRRGMDCSGFVCWVFKESFKIDLPHNASQQYKRCRYLQKDELKVGDLVFFSTNLTGVINHVGIYIGKDYFAHASTSYGVIVSRLSEPYYRKCYVAAGRLVE